MNLEPITIVIPFFNEAESIPFVLDELCSLFPHAEIIAVNDGSSDQTPELLKNFPVTTIHFPKNLGQSAALYIGLRSASHEICVMMDGDGQNDPSDIPLLVEQLKSYDVACGYRKTRKDKLQKRLASRFANHLRASLLGDGIRDTGCTLKAMKRNHVRYLTPFNGLHRYLPALLKNAGLSIVEVPVNHRPRSHGVSKYTVAGRAWRGIRDLIGVSWLMTRQIRWPESLKGL